jgi:hypothetical protein
VATLKKTNAELLLVLSVVILLFYVLLNGPVILNTDFSIVRNVIWEKLVRAERHHNRFFEREMMRSSNSPFVAFAPFTLPLCTHPSSSPYDCLLTSTQPTNQNDTITTYTNRLQYI